MLFDMISSLYSIHTSPMLLWKFCRPIRGDNCFVVVFFAKLIISNVAFSVLFVFCLKNVDVGRVFLGKID